jgi:hypothetical protein
MAFLRVKILISALAFPVIGSTAPLGPAHHSKELIVRQLEALKSSPAFAEFKSLGAEVIEVANYEAGLFIRYRLNNKECLAQLMVNSEGGRDQLVLDDRCQVRPGLLNSNPTGNVKIGSEHMHDMAALISAVRYLNRIGMINPPLDKTVAVRREGERVIVTFISVRTGTPCSINVIPPAMGRQNSHIWYLAGGPACESK